MKKIITMILVGAAAVLASVSCNKEEVIEASKDGTVRFYANEIKTKTEFGTPAGNKYPTLWTNTEKVKISLNYAAAVEATVTPSVDRKTADITPATAITDDASGDYTFYALSPAAAEASDINKTYKDWDINIPSTQTPSNNSVDEKAQIAIAVKSTGSVFPASVALPFAHVTAYGKLSFTNLTLSPGEEVTSVILTSPENWVGSWYYYFEDGHMAAHSGSKVLTINTDKTSDIWFACAPIDLQTKTLGIIVTTTDGSYSKDITFPSGKGNFEAGKIGSFTVDMSAATHLSLVASLPFSIDGSDGSAAYTTTAGLSASGLGSDYNSTHTPYLTKLDGTGDYIQVRFNEPAGKAAIGVKMIGGANTSYIDVKGSADGETFTQIEKFTISGKQNDIKSFETSVSINDTYRYIRFEFTKGSNIGVGPVSITKPSTDPVILSADIVDVPAVGTTTTTSYTIKNFVGADDVAATCDGTVVTSATISSTGTVTYTVAPNYDTDAVEGTITLSSASNSVNKVVSVSQLGETLAHTSAATMVIPKNASSITFTITSPTFSWNSSVTPETGMNLSVSPTSGSGNASEQTITISSTTDPIASEQTLGTVNIFRNGNSSDSQIITITVKKASSLASTSWVETPLASLTASDEFVIVGNGYSLSNGNGTTSAPTATKVTISAGKITSTVTDEIIWTLSGDSTNGYTFYPKGSTETWLYCSTNADSGSNNNIRVGSGARKAFLLESKDGNNYLVTNDSKVKRFVCQYNNSDWRGYISGSISSGNKNVTDTKFYKKVTE